MKDRKNVIKPWLKSLFIALPIGLLLGAPFPVLLYMSDAKDWGKGNYVNYWDFAWRYFVYGGLEVIAAIFAVWLISMIILFVSRKLKSRQS